MSSAKEFEIAGHLLPSPMFRPLESVDLSRTVAAFPGLQVVGELDDVFKQPLEVTMTEDWMAYFNARVMMELEKFYPGRLTHWRFLPDQNLAQLILFKAQSDKEYGATEVTYVETESASRVNLRLGLQALGVKRHHGRVWSFPLVVRTGADGKEYIALDVKGATTRPVQSRKKKAAGDGAVAAGPPATAGNPAPTPNAGTAATAPVPGTAQPAAGGTAPVKATDESGTKAAPAGSDVALSVQPAAGAQVAPAPGAGQEGAARTKTK